MNGIETDMAAEILGIAMILVAVAVARWMTKATTL
jgi:hypothetical protein